MTIPVYNIETMPVITYPLVCTQEETKKYLGNIAITGAVFSDVNTVSVSDEQQNNLFTFWRDTCNYGTEPFMIPLPLFGEMIGEEYPALFVKFIGGVKSTKKSSLWENKFKLEVIAKTSYNLDNIGNIIVPTIDDFILDGQGNYLPSNEVLTSYKAIVWQ